MEILEKTSLETTENKGNNKQKARVNLSDIEHYVILDESNGVIPTLVFSNNITKSNNNNDLHIYTLSNKRGHPAKKTRKFSTTPALNSISPR